MIDGATFDKAELRRYLRRKGLVTTPDKSTAAHLAAFGLAPDVVFDIGVDTGTPFLYAAFPKARMVLVDPRAESRAALKTAPPGAVFLETALGAAPGHLTLTIPHDEKGARGAMASLRKRAETLARSPEQLETREVAVTTLDTIAPAHPGRIGLKIDTEGFEAEVLRGGSETLRRTDFVILELSLTARFDGLAPPSAVIAMLAAAGLEFRDVLRMTGDGRGGPAPRLMDVLFTRWAAAPGPTHSP